MALLSDTPIDQPPEDGKAKYVFTLFVAGASPHSLRAISNLQEICDEHFAENYQIEVIDVYKNPLAAKSNQIIALPLLIRRFPLPERRIIGDLSETEKVLKTLAIIE